MTTGLSVPQPIKRQRLGHTKPKILTSGPLQKKMYQPKQMCFVRQLSSKQTQGFRPSAFIMLKSSTWGQQVSHRLGGKHEKDT